MEPYEFPAALNISTQRLDREVLIWAWKNRLFINPEELEKARIQKLNWFASYLFPEADEEVLRGTMKFFLWLFLIDDLMESESKISTQEFFNQLLNRVSNRCGGRYEFFLEVLPELEEWSKCLGDSKWQVDWQETWAMYLDGISWEFKNKINETPPSLSSYRRYRPYFSGVYLAIHLLRLPDFIGSCESNYLESKIARLICISNDLNSLNKESHAGDFHNEILILVREHKISFERATSFLSAEVKNLFRDIISLSELTTKISIPCSQWTKRLNLLLGGCLYWASQDTNRYQTLNGHSIKL